MILSKTFSWLRVVILPLLEHFGSFSVMLNNHHWMLACCNSINHIQGYENNPLLAGLRWAWSFYSLGFQQTWLNAGSGCSFTTGSVATFVRKNNRGTSRKWLEERLLSQWKIAQRAGKYDREAESIHKYLWASEITRERIKWETSLCQCVNPQWKHSLNIMGISDVASWTFLRVHFRSSSFEKGKEQKSDRWWFETYNSLLERNNSLN